MRHTRETIAAMFGSIRAVANLTRGAVLQKWPRAPAGKRGASALSDRKS